MEIERKFLVEKLPELPAAEAIHIEQGYISTDPVIRIRSWNNGEEHRYILTVKGGGMIVREEYELELPYCELKKRLRAAEREKSGSLVGYIVFTEDSFDKTYPIEARTYMVSSNNKAFQDGMGGYSIYGSSMDGEDLCVRLDGYMKDEHGGTNGWKIEKCYVYQDEKEIIDIIAGNFLIVNAPLESEHYESLSFGQLQKYRKKFENPEHFVRINGEITAIPYKAEKEKNHRGDGR